MEEKKNQQQPAFNVDEAEKQEKKKTHKKGKPHIVMYIISLITFAAVIYFGYKLYALLSGYTFLPEKYISYLKIGLIVISVFFGIYAVLPVNNLNKGLQSFLCALLAFALFEASVIIPEYKGSWERAFTPIPEEGEMNINIYALKSIGYSTINDLAGKKIALQSQLDLEYQEYALKVVNRELEGQEIEKVQYEDIYSIVEALFNKEVDAIMLNESYVEIVAENADFLNFRDDTQLIYTCTQKIKLDYNTEAVGDITTEPFIVMAGGNDMWSYDAIGKTSGCGRTDVNLLTVVNPNTKQILLVTIPRDSYVFLWGDHDCPDKLTHATTYSIDCWTRTINDFLGVKINYFIRVNFSSIVNIVDALGGIDIDNPYEFKCDAVVYNDLHYGTSKVMEKGPIHLNGAEALGYTRERHNLPDGDLGRNKHQAIVLKALVDKVTTVEGITHIGDLFKAIEGTFNTDISMDQIYALAQMQLDDMAQWDLVQYSITGYGDMQPCYALGLGSGNFSVVITDESSVKKAKTYISKILNNEIVTID